MRLVLIVWLSGCGLVWDVESYRASDAEVDAVVADSAMDVSVADVGPTDAEADVGDEDAGEDDGGVVDVGADVGDDCVLDSTVVPVSVTDELMNVMLEYGGTGAAIRVVDSGVHISNVEILLRNGATAIEVQSGVSDVLIENVRIQKAGPGTASSEFAIDVLGGEGSSDITIHNVEISGMEGIRVNDVTGAVLTSIRVDDPQGFGATDHVLNPTFGILLAETNASRLDDFAVTGPVGGRPKVTHALRFFESRALVVQNGYVSAPSADFPIHMLGRRDSTPYNMLNDVDVLNNPRGVELSGTSDWRLERVYVMRTEDCAGTDYAFAHVGVAADDVDCTDCFYGGCEETTPTLGQLTALLALGMPTLRPPLTFCWTDF